MSEVKPKFCLDEIGRDTIFEPPAPLLAGAHVSGINTYHDMYRNSIDNPTAFWAQIAAELYFETPTEHGLDWNFDIGKGNVFIRFMHGARTNIAYNCLERNIALGHGKKIAFYW